MNNLTLGRKIALGFSTLVALTLILGLVALQRFGTIAGSTEYISTDSVPGSIAISHMASALRENFGLVLLHVNARQKDALAASVEQNRTRIDQLIRDYEGSVNTTEERIMFTSFKSSRG